MDTRTLAVFGGLALFILVVVVIAVRARGRMDGQMQAMGEAAMSLGLTRSEAPLALDRAPHFVGERGGARVVVGFYGGGVPSINVARGSTAGVLLAVDSGVLPGNGWSADLGVNPPRLVGRGTGEDELAKLLERADLSAAAALPAPSLVAYEDMLPGGIFTTVVVDEWPEGWSGKTIWVVLPKDVDAEGLSQAMNAALRLRKDLRAAK